MRHLRLVRDEPARPHEIRATDGRPPVAIPGRPGWWRHWINNQQVDRPTRERSTE